MKIIYILAIVSSILVIGCRKKEEKPSDPVRTTTEYRELLEKRITSPNGANINVRQEVNTYENASDAEKRKMYDQAKELAK